MKLKILISIILFAILCTSCGSQRAGYRPPKRKKKDCNCSQWSYLPWTLQNKTTTLSFV